MILTINGTISFECTEPYVTLFVRDRVKASPPSSIGTNLTLFVRDVLLHTQHHLQVPVPTSPCLFVREERVIVAYQVPGTGTLSHSLILTLSLWLTWFKFKSIVYGTHAFLQKYQCNIYTALVPGTSRYPNDGHDLNSNQMSTYVYFQKNLYNISVPAVQQQ